MQEGMSMARFGLRDWDSNISDRFGWDQGNKVP